MSKKKKEVKPEVEIKQEIVPKYEFAPGQENITPAKRVIHKTMEVTETFTFWDVLKYVAKMDKGILDKQAELDALIAMKEAYLKEMNFMDDALGVSLADANYQKDIAEQIAKELEEEARKKNGKND